jgi:hypothetical protein
MGTTEGACERAASIADDIPIVSAEAVSESRIAAEEQEERLQEAERRAAVAEAARRAAEAERRAAVARLTQVERQLAAVLPQQLPQQAPGYIGNLHDDRLEVMESDANDDDIEANTSGRQQQRQQPQHQAPKNDDAAIDEGNTNSGGNSTPNHPSQRQRSCVMVVVVAVLIAAALLAGICGAVVRQKHPRQCCLSESFRQRPHQCLRQFHSQRLGQIYSQFCSRFRCQFRCQCRRPIPIQLLPALIPFSPISTASRSRVEH